MTFAAGLSRSGNLSARVQRRLRALEMRTRYRLGLPLPGPGHVGTAPDFRHPIDANRKSLLVARYRELFPTAVDEELAEARVLPHIVSRCSGHTVQHPERIEWSRDPVSGRDWSRGYSPDIPYRGAERLGDIKLPWELNKHQYLFTLGKASWLEDRP